jgi:hypothetical protein
MIFCTNCSIRGCCVLLLQASSSHQVWRALIHHCQLLFMLLLLPLLLQPFRLLLLFELQQLLPSCIRGLKVAVRKTRRR